MSQCRTNNLWQATSDCNNTCYLSSVLYCYCPPPLRRQPPGCGIDEDCVVQPIACGYTPSVPVVSSFTDSVENLNLLFLLLLFVPFLLVCVVIVRRLRSRKVELERELSEREETRTKSIAFYTSSTLSTVCENDFGLYGSKSAVDTSKSNTGFVGLYGGVCASG